MNKKMITHGLVIIAIVASVFIAASFTADKTYAQTSKTSAVANIAKVDFENRSLHSDSKMIADEQIPLAEMPSQTDMNIPLWFLIVGVSALMTGFVIYEDLKDRSLR